MLAQRSRSASGREGSLMRSLAGSPVPFSLQNEGPLSDDFQFRGTIPERLSRRVLTRALVPDEENSAASLRPDVNLKSLERKSHDFLK